MTAFRIIRAEKANGVRVSLGCELLEVSRSAYYEWEIGAPLGGFKRSSQQSVERGCDGQAEGMGVGCDEAAGDAFAGSADGWSP